MGPLKEAAALIVVKSVGLHDRHIFKSSIQKKSVLTKTDPSSFQFLLDNKGRDDARHVSRCRAHFSHSTENLKPDKLSPFVTIFTAGLVFDRTLRLPPFIRRVSGHQYFQWSHKLK